MLKKLVVLGIAGLMGMFLMVGSSYAKDSQGSSGCGGSQDQCEVNPTSTLQATIGMDVKLDFDVCVEWPEDLCGYKGCEQAIIAQKGDGNYGVIYQSGADFALIYQNGDYNWAVASQSLTNGGGAVALVFQNGDHNGAQVTQTAAASALVYQEGSWNIGFISQH
jgi:hypothetical protein